MKSKKPRVSLAERLHWYPVTTLGWAVTIAYASLLTYVIIEVNKDLYSVNGALFRAAIIISWIIVIILIWARVTGERPFCKKK